MHISHEFSSPNYDKRPEDATIDFIILHYTEMLFNDAMEKLCDPDSKVSCHYLIKEDGKIFQLVSDDMRSWHAGVSCWQGRRALNDCSIGIEIDNSGIDPFTDLQMESCITLCKSIMSNYNLSAHNIIGHSDIAPNRKIDPGLYFDWEKLASHGLGIYASREQKRSEVAGAPNLEQIKYLDIVSAEGIKSIQVRLGGLGYDIDITGRWDDRSNAVVRAFKAHFCAESLLKKGMDFYRDMNSKYLWDAEAERALLMLGK